MKGQSAFEMFVSIGIILVLVVPIILLIFSSTNLGLEDIALYQSKAVSQQIADGINKVYLEGNGTEKLIYVFIPSYTSYINISGKQVIVKNRDYEIMHPVLPVCAPLLIKERSGLIGLDIKSYGDYIVVSVKE